MAWALKQGNAQDFGRALHGYQDYFSHIASGYTFKLFTAGGLELLDKCIECFNGDDQNDFEMVERAFWNTGHVPFAATESQEAYTDRYEPKNNPRDERMRAGTEHWIRLFLTKCNRYLILNPKSLSKVL
jgi:hypothetical protein